jgi:hypothetical protein
MPGPQADKEVETDWCTSWWGAASFTAIRSAPPLVSPSGGGGVEVDVGWAVAVAVGPGAVAGAVGDAPGVSPPLELHASAADIKTAVAAASHAAACLLAL